LITESGQHQRVRKGNDWSTKQQRVRGNDWSKEHQRVRGGRVDQAGAPERRVRY